MGAHDGRDQSGPARLLDSTQNLPGLAQAWLPCDEDDLIGPGLAFDETAQLKDGDATACVAPQHAGCAAAERRAGESPQGQTLMDETGRMREVF